MLKWHLGMLNHSIFLLGVKFWLWTTLICLFPSCVWYSAITLLTSNMINACINNAYSIWRIIWLQPGTFDRNQTPPHLFLVPIDSSPSTTTSKHSHQLRYIVVFIPTLNPGSGLVCHVDLQVSRLSPQCKFWPGWDIVNGLVANILTPRHCFGVILGSSQCLLPALDHLEIFPWRLSQTVMQYQMWVDLLYM